MPPVLLLLVLFVSIPVVELYFMIQVGRGIGAGSTVALVVLTAVLGAVLVRAQGLATVVRTRAALDRGELPAAEMMGGVLLLLAGVLLLIPGFVTDALGFLLLVPPLRAICARALAARLLIRGVHVRTTTHARAERVHEQRTLEADYRVEDDDTPPR